MTFEQWKRIVDAYLTRLCGMTSDDIDDWNYYDAWEECMTPKEAAKQALKAAMTAVDW